MIKHQRLVMVLAMASVFTFSCTKQDRLVPVTNGNAKTATSAMSAAITDNAIPVNPNNFVAYYAFDATTTGGQAKLPITSFTDKANIVVMFEGTAWEVADSVHYGSPASYILNINGGPYKSYKQIRDDMKTLQARGIKVLWNVDDAASWNTITPFTTYDGTKLNATQYAAFVKRMIVDSLGLDGIALDVEHMGSTAANANFVSLVKAFGAYFGPKSSSPTTSIYTAAIYDGGQAGFAIGQSVDVASYMNFVMDMGYFEDNTTRFNRWANVIGAGKTMVGLSNQQNTLSNALAAAAWEPANGPKAGIMVFAGNVNKPYTDSIFATATPTAPVAASSPKPTNAATGATTTTTLSWVAGAKATSHNLYFGTTPSPAFIGNQTSNTYNPGALMANTTYYWRIDEQNAVGVTPGAVWRFTTGAVSGGISVSLASSFNLSNGIVTDGKTFTNTGGLDKSGYAYSSAFIGSSVTWSNTPFTLGAANAADAIVASAQTITVTAGKYSSIKLLASGVNGNQASQSFVVNYSDGTKSTFTQSISDWCTPQNYAGESKAVIMSYRDRSNGTKNATACNLYGYSFTVSSTKTVTSMKLPNNGNLRVLAITLVP